MYLIFLEDFNDQQIFFINSTVLLLGTLCISVSPHISVLPFQFLLPGLLLYLIIESSTKNLQVVFVATLGSQVSHS